jgi:broad specificity phosphatase PhoE
VDFPLAVHVDSHQSDYLMAIVILSWWYNLSVCNQKVRWFFSTMNKLYLVRHGENPANITKEISCRFIDYPLTAKGRLQAEQTAHFFKNKEIDEIYASPLKRAIETAEIIAGPLGLDVHRMENFRELDVGELETSENLEESWRVYFEVIGEWMSGNLDVRFTGGENYYMARNRMRAGVEQILEGKDGRNIIVVGHGGIFTTTAMDLCPGMDFESLKKVETHNCAISELDMQQKDGRWTGTLVRWADFSHLHGEAAEVVSGLP